MVACTSYLPLEYFLGPLSYIFRVSFFGNPNKVFFVGERACSGTHQWTVRKKSHNIAKKMGNGEKWARSGVRAFIASSIHCRPKDGPLLHVEVLVFALGIAGQWNRKLTSNRRERERERPTWIPCLVKLLFVTSSIRRYGVYFSTAKQAKATSSSPRENTNKRRKNAHVVGLATTGHTKWKQEKKKTMHNRLFWATYLWTFNCFNFVAYFYFLTMFCPFLGKKSRYSAPLACNHDRPFAKSFELVLPGWGVLWSLELLKRLFLRNFCVTDRVVWLFLQPLPPRLTSLMSNMSQWCEDDTYCCL